MYLSSAGVDDNKSNKWSLLRDMTKKYHCCAIISTDRKVLDIGGYGGYD